MTVRKNKEPRILFFDIETAANLAYVWGKYEQNVIDYEREWYMLSFAYKWNDGVTRAFALPDFDLYRKDPLNDRDLIRKLWELFDEADIIVAHNGDAFDIKKANARFLFHGLNPPSPYKTIDTKKWAKKYFQFNSNKLDDLGKLLNVGRKIKNEGFDLWLGCIKGDTRSWLKMIQYNKGDVDLLHRVYKKLRGWATNHPSMGVLKDKGHTCPVCGSHNLQKRGFGVTKVGKYQRYQCLDCGAWSRDTTIIRTNVTVVQ